MAHTPATVTETTHTDEQRVLHTVPRKPATARASDDRQRFILSKAIIWVHSDTASVRFRSIQRRKILKSIALFDLMMLRLEGFTVIYAANTARHPAQLAHCYYKRPPAGGIFMCTKVQCISECHKYPRFELIHRTDINTRDLSNTGSNVANAPFAAPVALSPIK